MRQLLAITVIVVVCASLSAQNQPAKRAPDQINEPSPRTATVKVAVPARKPPKVALEQAIEIAKSYAKDQKIDLSASWLYRVGFIMYGDTAQGAVPAWHVWWVNNDGGFGNYVEMIVTMDGKCMRASSL